MIKSLVKYIRIDTESEKASGFYPPIGTLGVIEEVDDRGFHVRWDEGTKGDGVWWCEMEDVKILYNPKTDGGIVAVRLFYAENRTTMAEMLFSNERSATIPWNARNASYIDARTLIYDERISRSFKEQKAMQKLWRT